MYLFVVVKEGHSDHDCFAVAVLTHGDTEDGQDVLYGTDRTIPIESFVAPIKSSQSLAGKPKIFIFQVGSVCVCVCVCVCV